jgi:DNA polymerase III delta prime subunit
LFDHIKGQEAAVRMLRNEIARGRLPSSALFHGPDGSGKFLTAMELARVLNCQRGTASPGCGCSSCVAISKLISRNLFLVCRSNLRNSFELWRRYGVRQENRDSFYRDLQRLYLTIHDDPRHRREAGELEGFLHSPAAIPGNLQSVLECVFGVLDTLRGLNISIEKMREIQRFLGMKSIDGRFKVVVIDGAENMNEESSNSILKVSEDTPPDSLIVMSTVDLDSIRETIRSRFRVYRFKALSGGLMREVLAERYGSPGEPEPPAPPPEVMEYARRFENNRLRLLERMSILQDVIESGCVIPFLGSGFSSWTTLEWRTCAGSSR